MQPKQPPAPIILRPGEGRSVSTMAGGTTTYKATGAETRNAFGLFETTLPPNARGPELHIHRRMIEMFWVTAGTVNIVAGDDAFEAAPGAFALVPTNTPHRFSNPSDTAATMLIMFTPGDDRERYFDALAELAQRRERPSREEVLALWHRYDQYLPGER